jgi:sodium/pantothenate symporter
VIVTTQIVIIIISIIAYIVVGLWAGKHVKNTEDYYVSGRNAPTILISGTLFASMLSTGGFMGETGWSYGGNFVNEMTLNALCGAGFALGCLFFGRYLRRAETITMPEYFGRRFNNKTVQKASGWLVVISITAYLLAVITGVGVLLSELTSLPLWACYVISFICFVSFTFYSGSKGVIITDTMMFMIFILGTLVAAPYLYSHAGGISDLLQNLMDNPNIPQGLLDYHGNFAGAGATGPFGAVLYGLTYGVVWFIVTGISPWQAGRHMMAKTEHVALRSGIIACFLNTIFMFVLHSMTMSLVNVDPSMEPERALVWGFANLAPVVIGSIALAGIMAAGLSSASTFLSVIGFSVTNDIFDLKFKDDKDQLRKSRIIMLLIGLIALALSLLNLGGIRILTWFASTLIASAWVVLAFGSVWSKKLSSRGALWGMLAGFFGFIIPKFLQGLGVTTFFTGFLDPFFTGVVLSLIFAFLGSRGQNITPEEISYRSALHIMPAVELEPKEVKITNRYTTFIIVVGVLFAAFLLVFWALPYNGII